MEIINKNTEDFGRSGEVYVSFHADNSFLISTQACKDFKLKPNTFIHFIFDLDRLYFIVNNDKAG